MIRAAVKNYFRYFKYVFAVMGVAYLGIFIAAAVFGGGFAQIFGDGIQTSFTSVSDYIKMITDGVKLNTVFSREFLHEVFIEVKDILNGQRAGAAGGTVAYAAVSVVVVILFCQLSKTVCRSYIKEDFLNARTRRGVIVFFIRMLIAAGAATVFFIISYLWIYSAIILALFNTVLQAVANLLFARFVYYPKAPLKAFLRPRILGFCTLAHLISLFINLAVIALIWFAFNPFISLILALPLIMYSSTIIEFTAVEYFKVNSPEAAA